jgi:hypothetical protein
MNLLTPSQREVIGRIPETPFSLMVCMAGEFSENIITLLKILAEQKDGHGQVGLLSSAIGLAKTLEMQAQSCKEDEGDFMQYLQSPARGNNKGQFFAECIIPLIGMRGRSFSESIEVIAAHIANALDLLLIEPSMPAPNGAPRWSRNSHVGLKMVNAFCWLLSVTIEDTIDVLESLHIGTLRQDHHAHLAGVVKQGDEESDDEDEDEDEQDDESLPVPGAADSA